MVEKIIIFFLFFFHINETTNKIHKKIYSPHKLSLDNNLALRLQNNSYNFYFLMKNPHINILIETFTITGRLKFWNRKLIYHRRT